MPDALIHKPFAIWLTPQKEHADYCTGLIENLCVKLQTPVFTPHCTLVSGVSTDLNAISEKTEALLGDGFKPITLACKKISVSDDFFKAIYIECSKTIALINLFETFRTVIEETRANVLSPHLSLAYTNAELKVKKVLAATLVLQLSHVTFNSVSVVHPANPELGWYDIAHWNVLFTKEL